MRILAYQFQDILDNHNPVPNGRSITDTGLYIYTNSADQSRSVGVLALSVKNFINF